MTDLKNSLPRALSLLAVVGAMAAPTSALAVERFDDVEISGTLGVSGDVGLDGDLDVGGTIVTDHIDLTGPNVLGSFFGGYDGSLVNTYSDTCDDGVLVGLSVTRYRKEDGDKDTYRFRLICR